MQSNTDLLQLLSFHSQHFYVASNHMSKGGQPAAPQNKKSNFAALKGTLVDSCQTDTKQDQAGKQCLNLPSHLFGYYLQKYFMDCTALLPFVIVMQLAF